MVHRDIVVIGGSAGAIEALQRIVRALDNHFSAAIFIVIHTAPGSSGFLPRILQRATVLPTAHPGDGDAIVGGRIYVAPPGHHLLVDRGVVRITKGPKENGFRPAVDPLFQTAVETYGSRVVSRSCKIHWMRWCLRCRKARSNMSMWTMSSTPTKSRRS